MIKLSFWERGLKAGVEKLLAHVHTGQLTITYPDGSQSVAGTPAAINAEVRVNSMRGIQRIFTVGGGIGLAEAYMNRELDTPSLYNLLKFAMINSEVYDGSEKRRPLREAAMRLYHWMRSNTKAGSKKNISAHYDLGNDFYQMWLDPSMTYSSGVYAPGMTDLAASQDAKYAAISEAGQIKPDSHVLEIGCGWGGFAEFAAKTYGCKVTGITISQEQFDFAAERIQREGLGEKVELRMQDYRDVKPQSFDRAVSIEMFEAVGEKYWPTYFGKVKEVLKPGGMASLQIITIADEFYQEYRDSTDFIQQYIFPGGMLPSPEKLREQTDRAGLTWVEDKGYADSYAKTLLDWNQRFQAAWTDIQALRSTFDERFRRMWEYYLIYCAVGFESPRLDVKQVALARPS